MVLGPGFVSPPRNVVLEQFPIDCSQTSQSVSPSIFATTAYHDVVDLATPCVFGVASSSTPCMLNQVPTRLRTSGAMRPTSSTPKTTSLVLAPHGRKSSLRILCGALDVTSLETAASLDVTSLETAADFLGLWCLVRALSRHQEMLCSSSSPLTAHRPVNQSVRPYLPLPRITML